MTKNLDLDLKDLEFAMVRWVADYYYDQDIGILSGLVIYRDSNLASLMSRNIL